MPLNLAPLGQALRKQDTGGQIMLPASQQQQTATISQPTPSTTPAPQINIPSNPQGINTQPGAYAPPVLPHPSIMGQAGSIAGQVFHDMTGVGQNTMPGKAPGWLSMVSHVASAPFSVPVNSIASSVGYAKGLAGLATGNHQAAVNGLKSGNDYENANLNMARGFTTRPIVQLGTSLLPHQQTTTPTNPVSKFLLGDTPVQNIEKGVGSTYANHPNLPTAQRIGLAGAYGGGQALQDLPVVTGAFKGFNMAKEASIPLDQAGAKEFTIGGSDTNIPEPKASASPATLPQSVQDAVQEVHQLTGTKPGELPTTASSNYVTPKGVNPGSYDDLLLSEAHDKGVQAQAPVEPALPRSQQSGLALDKPSKMDSSSFARAFDVPKSDAERILNTPPPKLAPRPDITPLERDATVQENMQPKMDREGILSQENQQTNHQLQHTVEEGNTKGGIASAEGKIAEAESLFEKAGVTAKNLDAHDKALLSERADPSVEISPHNPELFNRAAAAYDDAYDYHLAAQRLGGAQTLRYGDGHYSPLMLKATAAKMDELGIPMENRFQAKGYTGFRDVTRKYRSYTDAAQQHGLERANKDATVDAKQYMEGSRTGLRNAVLRTALEKTNPHEVTATGMGAEEDGRPFRQAAGSNLPFNVSENLDKQLTNYKKAAQLPGKAGEISEKGLKIVGGTTKKILFTGAPFHQMHITENVTFASLMGGEPKAFSEGILHAAQQGGGLSKPLYHDMLDHYRYDAAPGESDTLTFARNMGIKLEGNTALSRFVDSYALSLAKAAKKGGIIEGSPEALGLGKIYNHLLGRENAAVEGLNPTLQKLTQYFALAPNYMRTQLKLVYEALAPKKLGGAGYDKPFSLLTPGGAARSAVLGPRLFGALAAITAGAVIMQKFPTWQQAVNEAGLNPNNTNPNIPIKSKNSKGEDQVMNLPTDPLGLAFGLITDPKHFSQSRTSPVLSFGTKVASNTNWNGQPLTDPTKGIQLGQRAEKAGLNSFIPIGLQNYTNLQGNSNNPNTKQGTGQELGLRLKTDPNDPQVQNQKTFYNNQTNYTKEIAAGNFSAISPDLANVDPKYAAAESANYKAYQALNPGKDISGVQNSSEWNALSSAQKASFLTENDQKTGAQTLSPIYYINQQQAQLDPSRPHSPLYDPQMLTKDGVGFTLDANGNVTGTSNLTRAQIAIDYAAKSPTDDQKPLIWAANPWLQGYEKSSADYSNNYQQNMTQYMQNQGYTQPAINQFWQTHPSSTGPVTNAITPAQQQLLDNYSAITDPTAKAQYFQDNAKEMGVAFAANSQYQNQRAVAGGGLPTQDHPAPNANAAAGLAQLQKNPNHDKAIGKANAQLIQGNPDLSQYLADSGLYNTARDLAKYQFKDPSNPTLSAGQLLNLGRPIDQSTLSGVTNLGNYDIGKDASGKFSFLGAGGTGKLGAGASSGSSGGASHQKFAKFHKTHPRKMRVVREKSLRKPHRAKISAPRDNIHFSQSNKFILKDSNPKSRIKIG